MAVLRRRRLVVDIRNLLALAPVYPISRRAGPAFFAIRNFSRHHGNFALDK
jgi:hypothetical protein